MISLNNNGEVLLNRKYKTPFFGKNIKKECLILLKKLNENIENLTSMMQKSNLEDISMFLGSKKRMFFSNLFAGIFRGIGFGIGFTIITAVVIIILQKVILLNIPVIGDYLRDIVEILQISQHK